MEVTAESFCRWALELSDVCTEGMRQRHRVRVVPGPLWAMQYINGPQYLPKDGKSMKTWR